MNLNLSIYVEGQRLDLFKDESINIKSSLKDSMSPDKIFTAVSASYVVPASKANNRIFKHYYRSDIGNTIDARSFLDCELKIGGVLYRQGNLTLEKVQMDSGVAKSYSIRFYGNLTELTKRIGEDELIDLDFSGDDIIDPDWRVEMERNISQNPAVAFPVIANNSRFIFDSSDSTAAEDIGENYRNIAYSTATPSPQYGMNSGDLVGAYRCGSIMDVLEDTYGITITGALRAPYISNYRLLLTGFKAEENTLESFSGYSNGTFNDSVTGQRICTFASSGANEGIKFNTDFMTIFTDTWINFKVSSSTATNYSVHLLRNGTKIASVNQDTTADLNTYTSFKIDKDDLEYLYTFQLDTDSASATVNIDYYIKHSQFSNLTNITDLAPSTAPTTPYSLTASVSGGLSGTRYSVNANLPKMKVKDFFTVLFKQFNIVTIVDVLEIKTFHYDYFMSVGETIDISKYVYSSNSTISPPSYYSGLSFRNEDPVTYVEDAYFSENRKSYGSLEYKIQADGSKIVGSLYDVKTPTQRIPVERLTDLADGSYSRSVSLQLTDLNGDQVTTKPTFVYATTNNSYFNGSFATDIAVNMGGLGVDGLARHSIVTNLYYQFQSLGTTTAVLGNFWGVEIDEFHGDDRFDGLGYFNCFWKNYISHSFDYSTRNVELKAKLPLTTVLSIQMNTKLIIGTQRYIIKSMNTDFSTGITSFLLSSISLDLLKNIEASTLVLEREDSSTTNVKVVYLSSVTGRLEVSDSLTVNSVGLVKEVTEY